MPCKFDAGVRACPLNLVWPKVPAASFGFCKFRGEEVSTMKIKTGIKAGPTVIVKGGHG